MKEEYVTEVFIYVRHGNETRIIFAAKLRFLLEKLAKAMKKVMLSRVIIAIGLHLIIYSGAASSSFNSLRA